MRGSCTLFQRRVATFRQLMLFIAVGCGGETASSESAPSSSGGAGGPPPAGTGVSGHSASGAGHTAIAGTSVQTGAVAGTGGAGTGTASTAGTIAPTPAGTGAMAAGSGGTGGDAGASTGEGGAAAVSGGTGGAAGGGKIEPPDTLGPFPEITAEQIGTPMRLSAEFELAEGPLWHPCLKKMLFTDVEHSAIHTIEPDGTFGVFRKDTNHANGITFDKQGRIVQAEMGGNGGGRVTRLEKDGTLTVLADKTPSGGRLNTTDDVIVRSDGTIYFSDPVIAHGPNPSVSITSKPLYRLPMGMGTPVQEGSLSLPNGVDLSPDEKTLYVAEFLGGRVSKYPVAEDGSLGTRATFLSGLTNPDSMCLDAAGNLYIGVEQGLVIAKPDGTRVKTVSISTNKGVTNCEFGGEDGKTLYITAWASLWKLENMPIPGLMWSQSRKFECN